MKILINKTQLKNIIIESKNETIVNFLSDKNFTNHRSKQFLYHGTHKHPSEFILKDDYDYDDKEYEYSGDLPEGYIFLTTSIEEASAYGMYVIPFELKRYDNKTFKVDDFPSRVFDRDYGIDLYTNDKDYGFWDKFENSGKHNLIITGKGRSTVITDIFNAIPRTDLAIEFYKQ
jgi:hypothetical protein